MRRITLAIAATGAVATLVLTGCGASPTQLGGVQLAAAEVVQQSVQKAEAVTSYTVDAVVNVTGNEQNSGRIQGTMRYRSQPQLAADLTLSTVNFGGRDVPGGARAILLEDTVYVKVDALNKAVGATKPWIKASLSDLDSTGQARARELVDRVRQFDLAGTVQMISTSKDVQAVGTETVGGVETTHYSGTFPVETALAQLDPDKRDHVREELDEIENMRFDMWADAQNLPRKITLSGEAHEGSFDATMLFTGFNEPVEISAPPADQVGELPERTGDAPTGN